jgi:tRNA dimethylallyltransferase
VGSSTRPPAVLLMGPTASGKTGLAVELAQRFPFEIVNVDSAQVYRHMDIGTAKPDRRTLERASHHLIYIVDPNERYSAARFCEDANTVLPEIHGRGNIALLTGGTMLYFKTLTEGLSELPAADPDTRLVIDAMAQESGWPALHAELTRIDPETAARLQPQDAQRVQRALEVFYLTGHTMSALIARGRAKGPPYRMITLALQPGDRSVLHERIAQRFEIMLELGLIGEVRGLRERFELNASLPSMRAVGYRQTWQYLDGELSLAELREKGIAATRQLAKRQLTWLRSWPEVKTFDCLDDQVLEQLSAYIVSQLQP